MNQLDKKLYELFADKTLSQGCMLMSHVLQVPVIYLYSAVSHHVCWHDRSLGSEEFDTTVILGHPPELYDVLLLLANRKEILRGLGVDSNDNYHLVIGTKSLPYNPTLPLLKQSDETKQAIISLFE